MERPFSSAFASFFPASVIDAFLNSDTSLSRPDLPCAETYDIHPGVDLSRHGIDVFGDVGQRNRLIIDPGQVSARFSVRFDGVTNSTLIIGRSAPVTGSITFRGHNAVCCFAGLGGAQGLNTVNVNVEGDGCLAYFGRNVTLVHATFIIEGENRNLIVHDDCMFSWNVFVRNYDSHTVFDVDSGRVLNDASDIRIGAHVWVGQDVLIGRGVSIGAGSIIGMRSCVLSDIPEMVAVGGSPAKVLRTNVSWLRSRFAQPTEIAEQIRLLGAHSPIQSIETFRVDI